jgi:hypothetical protein
MVPNAQGKLGGKALITGLAKRSILPGQCSVELIVVMAAVMRALSTKTTALRG